MVKNKTNPIKVRAIQVLRQNGFKSLDVCWLLSTSPPTIRKYEKQ